MEKLDKIEEMLISINKSVILIEDQITTKFPTLFDTYAVNYENNEKNMERITSLENVVENNSMKISVLEENSKKHSEQLSHLVS